MYNSTRSSSVSENYVIQTCAFVAAVRICKPLNGFSYSLTLENFTKSLSSSFSFHLERKIFMSDLHEQIHASLRISAFASLLCASVKYPPRSILDLLLWYPKNRNSFLHEIVLLAEPPFLIFMPFEGATLRTCLMLSASLVCEINCQKFCPLLWLMLPTSLIWEVNCQ
jgi:hypothetical protein